MGLLLMSVPGKCFGEPYDDIMTPVGSQSKEYLGCSFLHLKHNFAPLDVSCK